MNSRKVILIMTDTQGTNVVGCYGDHGLKTPRINQLAQEGVRFDNAYTVSPVCGPARSAIFTGTFPHTNGCWGNNMSLGAEIKTVGQRLRDNGFKSAYTGKWHLDGSDYFGTGKCPPGWDSDYWFDMRCYLEGMSKQDRELSRNANRSTVIHEHNITEEFTYAHQCSDRALDFLSKHHEDDFFLTVSYDEPHEPCTCPPPYCDMYNDYEYPLAANVRDTFENKPANQREWASTFKIPESLKKKLKLKNSMYFGCNTYVDYEIGRVIDAIDKYAPDALVIFTSDHGAPLLTHGLNSKGPAMYEETISIPFIARWPSRIEPGQTSAKPVSRIDITPTVLDVFGLDIPDYLEGESLVKTFEKPDSAPAKPVFMEFNRYEINHDGWGGFQPIRATFNGHYKLVINLHYTDELYDLHEDPGEMKNLIDSPGHKEIRDNLHDQILDWMNATRDPFRGCIWERRPWRNTNSYKLRWNGPTRPRPDDGYMSRMLDYSNGLEIESYIMEKN